MAKVTINWDAVSQNVDGDPVRNVKYQVRRNGTAASDQIYEGTATTYTDESAPDNATVIYYIRAIEGTCIGDWGNLSVKTGDTTDPKKVEFTLSKATSTINTLRGGTDEVNITDISPTTTDISVSSDDTSVATVAISGTGASRKITITSAGTAGTASIGVKGTATGYTNTTKTISVTVRDTTTPTCNASPAKPTVDLSADDDSSISADVSSSTRGVNAATSYRAQIRRKGSTSWGALRTSSSGSFTFSGLSADTTYQVRALARNACGSSAYSDIEEEDTDETPTDPCDGARVRISGISNITLPRGGSKTIDFTVSTRGTDTEAGDPTSKTSNARVATVSSPSARRVLGTGGYRITVSAPSNAAYGASATITISVEGECGTDDLSDTETFTITIEDDPCADVSAPTKPDIEDPGTLYVSENKTDGAEVTHKDDVTATVRSSSTRIVSVSISEDEVSRNVHTFFIAYTPRAAGSATITVRFADKACPNKYIEKSISVTVTTRPVVDPCRGANITLDVGTQEAVFGPGNTTQKRIYITANTVGGAGTRRVTASSDDSRVGVVATLSTNPNLGTHFVLCTWKGGTTFPNSQETGSITVTATARCGTTTYTKKGSIGITINPKVDPCASVNNPTNLTVPSNQSAETDGDDLSGVATCVKPSNADGIVVQVKSSKTSVATVTATTPKAGTGLLSNTYETDLTVDIKDAAGTAIITVTFYSTKSGDRCGTGTSKTFNVVVREADDNEAPVFDDPGTIKVVIGDTAGESVEFEDVFSDPDDDDLSFSLRRRRTATGFTFSVVGDTLTVKYGSSASEGATSELTYRAIDDGGLFVDGELVFEAVESITPEE